MTRFVNALLIFLMVLSAAAVYDMKYEAELAASNVARIQRQIAQEQEAISLLKAEWSVLTQPARLQDLVTRHADILELEPMRAEHVGTLADVPPKPVDVPVEEMPDEPEAPATIERSAQAAPAAAGDPIDIQ
ncbi:cell division protein FtsL [Chthonobacter rhizosphaerae]|uniref:cell division protein FtsL n=1 Tax=Chthonobacter rhizosphaerae TaxID=2735553 RepID=UPI0015EE9C97|nr:hypothetical protein [Chthonobacter rhizosphaerae]